MRQENKGLMSHQKQTNRTLNKCLENKSLEINKENLMLIARKYKKNSKTSHNDGFIISMQ